MKLKSHSFFLRVSRVWRLEGVHVGERHRAVTVRLRQGLRSEGAGGTLRMEGG